MKCKSCPNDSYVVFATRAGLVCDSCYGIMQSIINEAKDKHGKITYCGDAKTWNECFTFDNNHMMFWFNVDKNTHAIRRCCETVLFSV